MTDQGKELVTQMAEAISRAERVKPDARKQMIDYQRAADEMSKAEAIAEIVKPDARKEMIDYERAAEMSKANGGIIGLKDGGMDDMMQADSLMFRDPSDEGEWEYNV